ncbi:LOW QUALITY PROTEIN: phospholipase DDHD1 [Alosa alosa]|uniref:LOW QUALITY PROTEIN: phospholipase DDHD1 n=1 Tax=Alosa alosa TaxID=278164 RepID=UPI0020154C14|nr:LOW QUALITY PROTEIN: phospholipase DDHD1 [Alosa alosa]
MSSFPNKSPFISPPLSPGGGVSSINNNNREWGLGNEMFVCSYDESSIGAGMHAVQSGFDRHLPLLQNSHQLTLNQRDKMLDESYPHNSDGGYFNYGTTRTLNYRENDGNVAPPESRKRHRSNSSRQRFEVVTELGPEEVRWFYKEDKKTWKPFVGHDSLKIEVAYRKYCELNPGIFSRACPAGNETQDTQETATGPAVLDGPQREVPTQTAPRTIAHGRIESVERSESSEERDLDSINISVEAVCVRGGLYEVDVREKECYPVYWNQQDRIPVMRGQWFIDGTWLPMEEEESDLIEAEHLAHFRGQQMQDTFDPGLTQAKTVDSKDVLSHLPPFYLTFLFKWRGYQTSTKTTCHKRKRCQAIHSVKLSRSHVDWHCVDEVYLYSDATTSKIARTVTQKLGFSKASSSGTRLHRGYVEEASLEDKPPQTTHIVFVVHGIGQKMDQGRIIRNTGMMREAVRKMEEKHFAEHIEEHVEFLPVEWRSKLALDGDTVDSITPDKVRGLRDLLNSSAMDIMYYTSPLYRDEITKGLTQELNRLYSLFCSRNPEFEAKGGKVSMVSHSLGCVIAYDIMTGWDPVRFIQQEQQELEQEEQRWVSYEERHLLEQLHITRHRLRELEEKLQGLEASKPLASPALMFKVENLFCMGSPLAVFLALRGIRPGTSGLQDHIMPATICTRLFNVFHPTDPVAYRLEPLILKHYSNIAPVQIHWCNTTNPTPYDEMRITFLNPTKDSVSDTESIPSPSTSPVMPRRHYGESITNLGKAGIMGAASIGKGIGGMIFSRFSRSSSQPAGVGTDTGLSESDEKSQDQEPNPNPNPAQSHTHTHTQSQSAYGLSTMSQSTSNSTIMDTTLELEHRIDFELREGMVESRYWSAVTSHTAYWSNLDVALFLLTFIYEQRQSAQSPEEPSHESA